MKRPSVSHRNLVKLAGAGVLGAAGVAVLTGHDREQWRFETGDEFHSSPTVVDALFSLEVDMVTLYAVDAATGDDSGASPCQIAYYTALIMVRVI